MESMRHPARSRVGLPGSTGERGVRCHQLVAGHRLQLAGGYRELARHFKDHPADDAANGWRKPWPVIPGLGAEHVARLYAAGVGRADRYTVWAVVKINGQWYASGIIQMWRERPSTGAPLLTDFARNWVYDSRWGPMQGHQPVVGEQMGFFLSAGNARGVGTVTSVRERTNVVMVPVPAGDTGVFTFSNQKTTMDFDGDCRTDIGIFRPSTGEWWGLASTSNYVNAGRVVWGISTDIPVPADYDGDGKTDVGVFRPSNGTWYILLSSTGFQGSVGIKWGMSGDIPVPGDYDGDGKADLAVHRPSTGTWGILRSSSNYTTYAAVVWGMNTRHPCAGRRRWRRLDRHCGVSPIQRHMGDLIVEHQPHDVPLDGVGGEYGHPRAR